MKTISCPTCKKQSNFTPENLYRPFCSERCKLIDLGEWASEKFRVAGPEIDPAAFPDDEDHK